MGGMCFIDTLTRITVKMSWKDDALLCYHIPSLISKQQSICINLYSKLYFVSYYWWTLTKSTFLMCQKVRFFAKYPPPHFARWASSLNSFYAEYFYVCISYPKDLIKKVKNVKVYDLSPPPPCDASHTPSPFLTHLKFSTQNAKKTGKKSDTLKNWPSIKSKMCPALFRWIQKFSPLFVIRWKWFPLPRIVPPPSHKLWSFSKFNYGHQCKHCDLHDTNLGWPVRFRART